MKELNMLMQQRTKTVEKIYLTLDFFCCSDSVALDCLFPVAWSFAVDPWQVFYCHLFFKCPLLTLLTGVGSYSKAMTIIYSHSQNVPHCRISLHSCSVSLQYFLCKISILTMLSFWGRSLTFISFYKKYSLLVQCGKSFYYHLQYLKIISIVLGFFALMPCYIRNTLVLIYWIPCYIFLTKLLLYFVSIIHILCHYSQYYTT